MAPTTTTTITAKQCSRCLERKSLTEFDFLLRPAERTEGARKSFCKLCTDVLSVLWAAREKKVTRRRPRKRSTRSRPQGH